MGKYILLFILFFIFVGPVIFNMGKKGKKISYTEAAGGLLTSIAGIGCMIPIIVVGLLALYFIYKIFFGG